MTLAEPCRACVPCLPPCRPPQRHTKEVKLQRDEQAYIDDLVKKVHVHKQHSKLTK